MWGWAVMRWAINDYLFGNNVRKLANIPPSVILFLLPGLPGDKVWVTAVETVYIYTNTVRMSKNLVCVILHPYPTISLPFPNINSWDSRGWGGRVLHCILLCIITSNLNSCLLIQLPTGIHTADTPHSLASAPKPASVVNPLYQIFSCFHMLLKRIVTKGGVPAVNTLLKC